MGNDVTAVFGGDIAPMEKAMAQLRAAMKTTAANAAKDLTFKPRIDDTALKAATANIAAHMKQLQSGAAFRPVLPPPAPVRDFAGSNAVLDRAFAGLPPELARRAGSFQGGGAGMRGFQTTNAANQLQDIAVQMQMGTRMTTIFAQQVPQLLSAFGPGAALAGGAVAVAGLLMTVGANAKNAFDNMIKGADDSHKQIGKLLATGGVRELSAAMTQMKDQVAQFDDQRKKNATFGGQLAGGLGMLMGGDSRYEQETKMIIAQTKAGQLKLDAQKRLKEVSADDLKIAQLRSKGLDEEADGMERKIALARTLADIEASDSDKRTKDELKKNAIAISYAEAQTKFNAKAQQDTDERRKKEEALGRSLREQQRGLTDDRTAALTGVDRLKALEEQQKQRRSDAALNGLSLSDTGIAAKMKGGDIEGAEKSVKALREYEATQREIEALQKSMREDAANEAETKALKDGALKAAREEFALEMQLSRVLEESAGKETAKSKAIQDQLNVMRLAKQIQDQLNIGSEAALNLAHAKYQLDDQAATAAKTKAQQANVDDIKTRAAINHARAHGHTRKAERMEMRASEDAKVKDLMANGVPEAEAKKMAQTMQRDEDKLAGRRSTIRSNHKWVDNFGIDKASFPALDAMKAQQGKSLRSEMQFPALDAMAKRQAAANATRANAASGGRTEPLLESIERGIGELVRKFNFVN